MKEKAHIALAGRLKENVYKEDLDADWRIILHGS
jgi:hypothetical protein